MTINWNVVAALATSVSAGATAITMIVLAHQTHLNAKTNEFTILQKFAADSRELWRACADSKAVDFSFWVGAILGHFELFCIALSSGEFDNKAYDYIVETIIDYLDSMAEKKYHFATVPLVEKAHVCKELKSFSIQHSHNFTNAASVFDMLGISHSSL